MHPPFDYILPLCGLTVLLPAAMVWAHLRLTGTPLSGKRLRFLAGFGAMQRTSRRHRGLTSVSDALRRAAPEEAIRTGSATTTDPITLVQE